MQFSKQDISDFKAAIESIIDAKLDNRRITNYVAAIVDSVDSEGYVSVVIPPEMTRVITGLLNKTGEKLNHGDSVEIATKNGALSNSWIAVKHGTNNSGGGGGGGTTDYNSLDNRPRLSTTSTTSLTPNSNETIGGVIELHRLSKTGSWNDIIGKPTIVTPVNADWNATSGLAQILNKPTVPDGSKYVLKSGDTMTGSLNFTNNNLITKNSNVILQEGSGSVVLSAPNERISIRPISASDTSVQLQFYTNGSFTLTKGGVTSNILDTSSIVDNATSTSVSNPLSANQGKILNDKIVAHIGVGGTTQHPIGTITTPGFSTNNYNDLANRPTNLEVTTNKVAISSTATSTQYPNAKSVYDFVTDAIATVPQGLKIPKGIDKESDLPTTGQQDGDYYFVQNMDITAPGHTGVAWWNSAESTTSFLKEVDMYQSMDGISITQTGGGEWEVNKAWLQSQMPTLNYLPLTGGTLTGQLTLPSRQQALKFAGDADIGCNAAVRIRNLSGVESFVINIAGAGNSYIRPGGNKTSDLGTTSYRWNVGYITSLNNGANIAIPTTAGTLALTSDIPTFKTINGEIITGTGDITINSGTWGNITGTLSNQTDLQNALNSKQPLLVSGTNIKTINGESVLGSGNIEITGGDGVTTAGVPIGMSILWWGTRESIPDDYMFLEGQSLLVSEFQSLFAKIGYTYGGSGNYFNLPNLQGKMVMHADGTTEFLSLGQTGGNKTYSLTSDNLASHTHTFSGNALASHTHTFSGVSHTHTFTGTALATHTHTFSGNALGSHSHQEYLPDTFRIASSGGSGAYISDGTNPNYPYPGGVYASNTYTGNTNIGTPSGSNSSVSAGTPSGTNAGTTATGTNTSVSAGVPSGTISNTGNGTAFSLLQPYIVGYYVMKVKEDAKTSELRDLDTQVAQMAVLSQPYLTTGSANAYTINNGNLKYKEGDTIKVKFHATNTSTTVNLNINGDGNIRIYRYGTTAPHTYQFYANSVWDLTLSNGVWIANGAYATASTTITGVTILNNTLTSTSTAAALTAAQGKVINDRLVTVEDYISTITTVVNQLINEDNQRKYYVGKIIMDTANVNPATYLGFGTWVPWGSGRVPVGMGNNGTNNYTTVEATGGSDNVTLNTNQIPSHGHTIRRDMTGYEIGIQGGSQTGNSFSGNFSASAMYPGSVYASNTGGGQSHENRMSYITCYMWKRTE